MAPNTVNDQTGVLFEGDVQTDDMAISPEAKEKVASDRKYELVWRNIILFAVLHVSAVYGLYLFLFKAMWMTNLFALTLYVCSLLGITAGAHRQWAHKAYKAKWPLRLILVFFNTIAFQDAAIDWARDHRMHHKYTETDADPHNSARGFFFCHVGWLLVKKHPELIKKGKGIDMSDLYADPILRFQKKYYLWIMPLISFIIPTMIPVYYWNESWSNSWYVVATLRYCASLNVTWLVNSAAHLWGPRPYDKNMNPAENKMVSAFAIGEGFHNYHHTFPWDYKTAELESDPLNFTTTFINFFSKIGWAYDLKTVPKGIVEKRVKRTGDGSHAVWGWGDKDLDEDSAKSTEIINGKSN